MSILKVDYIPVKQCVDVEWIWIFKVIFLPLIFNHSLGLTLQDLFTKGNLALFNAYSLESEVNPGVNQIQQPRRKLPMCLLFFPLLCVCVLFSKESKPLRLKSRSRHLKFTFFWKGSSDNHKIDML